MDPSVSKKVDKIEFGLMSPKFIKDMASAKIVTPELYDKEGYPVDGGLMDIRLGVIDPGLKCKSCGQKLKECPGHFGFIELARPVIHIKFVSVILDLLRSICRGCGNILIPNDKINRHRDELEKVGREFTVGLGFAWTFLAILVALAAFALAACLGICKFAVGLFVASFLMAAINIIQSLGSVTLKLWNNMPLFSPILIIRGRRKQC